MASVALGGGREQDLRRPPFPGPGPDRHVGPPVDGRPRPRSPSTSPSRARSSASWPTSPTRAFFDEKPAAVYIPFRQHVWQYAREDEWIHTRKVLAIRTSIEPLDPGAGGAGGGGPGRPRPDGARLQDDGRSRPQLAVGDATAGSSRRCSRSSACSRSCSRWWASTASCRGWSASGRASSAFAWPSARAPATSSAMLLGQSLRPILLGLRSGALGGFGLSRGLNAMFFRMTTAEPLVFVAIAALMLAVALGAAWVPARRVTRIDPAAGAALRVGQPQKRQNPGPCGPGRADGASRGVSGRGSRSRHGDPSGSP